MGLLQKHWNSKSGTSINVIKLLMSFISQVFVLPFRSIVHSPFLGHSRRKWQKLMRPFLTFSLLVELERLIRQRLDVSLLTSLSFSFDF